MKRTIFIRWKHVALYLVNLVGALPFVKNHAVAILGYHSLTLGGNKYAISKEAFIAQITKIQKSAAIISLDAFIDAVKRGELNKSIVAITIDDGYKNVLSIIPFVKKHKIPLTLFVLADPHNANRKELDTNEELLSIQDLQLLHSLGWEIGCHSSTHANLTALSKRELAKEIIDAKKILEKKLGFSVNYFAYPKGLYTKEIAQVVEKAGYKAAFTTDAKNIDATNDIYTLPRIVIEQDRSLSDFPACIRQFPLLVRSLFDRFYYIYGK